MTADSGQNALFLGVDIGGTKVAVGLVDRDGTVVRLTGRGRMISNEVFERFITTPAHV